MMEREIFMGGAMVIAMAAFNFPVFSFTRKLMNAVDFKHITSEKDAPAPPAPAAGSDPAPPVGSSSRVVAVMASVVLCCFLWGVGNYLIFAAFFESDKIAGFLGSLINYFVPGLTLYAPYGVNKMTSAFKS